MKFYDMFSGIGGFHLGLERASPEFECLGACEIDDRGRRVYSSHWPGIAIDRDATRVERPPPGTDLICGGFPCQAFSVAGKRGGFDDTRGTLFFDIARIARHGGGVPYLLLENVPGLLTHDEGRTFATILGALDECGYDAQWACLSSLGAVPQARRRVYIVGHLRGLPRPEIFPEPEGDRRRGRPEQDGELEYARTLISGFETTIIGSPLPAVPVARTPAGLDTVLSGRSMNDRFYAASGAAATLTTTDSAAYMIPADPADPVPGAGIYWSGGRPYHLRVLTPLERERVMGFPDGWTRAAGTDDDRKHVCGNAVAVPVITWLGRRLHAAYAEAREGGLLH